MEKKKILLSAAEQENKNTPPLQHLLAAVNQKADGPYVCTNINESERKVKAHTKGNTVPQRQREIP